MHWTLRTLVAVVLLTVSGQSATADSGALCPAGQSPQFGAGFAALHHDIGDVMGAPTTCEFPDPTGTGDVEQQTSTGLAFWRKSTNTSTFTNGSEHWALVAGRITHWTGASVDPPSVASGAGSEYSAFAGDWYGHGRGLEVRDNGAVFITYRTYRVCGQDAPPCDDIVGDEIVDGGRITVQLQSGSPTSATGIVVASSDPSIAVGASTELTLDPYGAVDVQIGNTPFASFCGSNSPAGYCGA